MRVAVLGASGIIGQSMHVTIPDGVEAVFTRRTAGPLCQAFGMLTWLNEPAEYQGLSSAARWLDEQRPEVIVNLIGENNPDQVERDPSRWPDKVNHEAALLVAAWASRNGAHFIQASSQAAIGPINRYGKQKAAVEAEIAGACQNWTIVRPTFVLGIRPFPGIGRENPVERMLAGRESHSVDNRWFSVAFAWDVAAAIWKVVLEHKQHVGKTYNLGGLDKLSRYDVATKLGCNPEPVLHESLMSTHGLADRPRDTTYTENWGLCTPLQEGIEKLKKHYLSRETDDRRHKSLELAAFLNQHKSDVFSKLNVGFLPLHHEVTEDFNRVNPQTNEELLAWYRTTPAYLHELSAFHCDGGYNYHGQCRGIAEGLKAHGVKRVLCLGDGVGSLTLALRAAGFNAIYHDLAGSRTAAFAAARFCMRGLGGESILTSDFSPEPVGNGGPFDAVVSLDFLEHVRGVETWCEAIHASLRPGGFLVAQNAFGVGSASDGNSIPMHLSENDRFVTDWDPLLSRIGFTQIASNWYRRP